MEIKSQPQPATTKSSSLNSTSATRLSSEPKELELLSSKSEIRSTIVDLAKKEIGFKEDAKNSNKFGQSFGKNFQPWCGLFVDRIMADAGAQVPTMAHAQGGYNSSVTAGIFRGKTHTPDPGDVVFFNFPGGRSIDHVGLVLEVSADGKTITTIEGNTSSGAKGSQKNGDGVYKRERSLSHIAGYAIPRGLVAESLKDH
jgi:hypothetical protein